MLQMNSKELKAFRDTLALWHIADFKLADEINQKNARVNNLRGLIESNQSMIERIEKGEKLLKNLDELKAEITTFEGKIDAENEALKKLREEYNKDIAKGRELVTEEVVNAMNERVGDIYNAELSDAYAKVLVKWFESQGAKGVTTKDVYPFVIAVGQKKNSARQKARTNRHNGTMNKNASIDIFLGAICDEPSMVKALPTHKWVTIIERKTSNK